MYRSSKELVYVNTMSTAVEIHNDIVVKHYYRDCRDAACSSAIKYVCLQPSDDCSVVDELIIDAPQSKILIQRADWRCLSKIRILAGEVHIVACLHHTLDVVCESGAERVFYSDLERFATSPFGKVAVVKMGLFERPLYKLIKWFGGNK